MDIFPLYKPLGYSPLDTIKLLKEKYPQLREEKMTYAGRLDPMAEGLILILKGDKLKEFKKYLNLDKSYKARILFGFSTDSYDVLGLAESKEDKLKEEDIIKKISSFKGKTFLEIPPFSSHRVKGKPLFHFARKGEEINLPLKEREVYELNIDSITKIKKEDLEKLIFKKLETVKGDFRQEEIKKRWKEVFRKEKRESFFTAKFELSCESGFYLRSMANHSGGILLDLKRTKVGEFSLKEALKLF